MKCKQISEFLSKYNLDDQKFCEIFFSLLTFKQLKVLFLGFNTDGSIFLNESQIARLMGVSRQNIDIIMSHILKLTSTAEEIYNSEHYSTTISKNELLVELINKINNLKCIIAGILVNSEKKDSLNFDNIINTYNLLIDNLKKSLIKNKCRRISLVKTSKKAQELINTINKIHRLPLFKSQNNGKSEFTFENGMDQRNYYTHLCKCIRDIQNKKNNNEELSVADYQKLYDYQEINKVLHKTTLSYKAQQLIDTINIIHRLPLLKFQNNGKSEFTFEDGSDQRNYYTYLCKCIRDIQNKKNNNEELSVADYQKLYDYQEINRALSGSSIKLSDKAQAIIDNIYTTRKLSLLNNKGAVVELSDEDDKYYSNLYSYISIIYEKINNHEELSISEYQILYDYQEINKALKKSITSYKAQKLIETINTIHRLPLLKIQNNGKSEFTFEDGSDQRQYYVYLRNCIVSIHKKIDNNEELSAKDYQKLYDYQEINKALKKSIISYKAQKLIETINAIHRLPHSKNQNNGKSEFTFEDGSDQRRYYDYLNKCIASIHIKIDNNDELSVKEYQKNVDYTAIKNVLSFYNINSKNNVTLICLLLNSLEINVDINKDLLSKSFYEVYVKFKFLIDNNIPLISDEGLINKIMYMSDIDMKEKYNITIDELVKKYINGYVSNLETVKQLVKH